MNLQKPIAYFRPMPILSSASCTNKIKTWRHGISDFWDPQTVKVINNK
jgi:hypothetical protein